MNLVARLRGGPVRVDMMQVEPPARMIAFYNQAEPGVGFLSNFSVTPCRVNVLVGTPIFASLGRILSAVGVDMADLQFTTSDAVFMLIKAMVFRDWAAVHLVCIVPVRHPRRSEASRPTDQRL